LLIFSEKSVPFCALSMAGEKSKFSKASESMLFGAFIE